MLESSVAGTFTGEKSVSGGELLREFGAVALVCRWGCQRPVLDGGCAFVAMKVGTDSKD